MRDISPVTFKNIARMLHKSGFYDVMIHDAAVTASLFTNTTILRLTVGPRASSVCIATREKQAGEFVFDDHRDAVDSMLISHEYIKQLEKMDEMT